VEVSDVQKTRRIPACSVTAHRVGPRDAIIHSNDNLRVFAAGGNGQASASIPGSGLSLVRSQRTARMPMAIERGDAPIDGFDEQDHCTTGGVSDGSSIRSLDLLAGMSAGSPWTSERFRMPHGFRESRRPLAHLLWLWSRRSSASQSLSRFIRDRNDNGRSDHRRRGATRLSAAIDK